MDRSISSRFSFVYLHPQCARLHPAKRFNEKCHNIHNAFDVLCFVLNSSAHTVAAAAAAVDPTILRYCIIIMARYKADYSKIGLKLNTHHFLHKSSIFSIDLREKERRPRFNLLIMFLYIFVSFFSAFSLFRVSSISSSANACVFTHQINFHNKHFSQRVHALDSFHLHH